jgi:ribose 5-phosphate isomerase A
MGDPEVRAKELAGRHAATYVEAGMRVGLGTGSTVRHTTLALGARHADITCTATSVETEELARSVGLTVVTPDEIGALDLAIDGADEVATSFDLTKGGGGAHTREKLVAEMSPRFIVVVDESKLVDQLGPFGTPLEVLHFAPGVVARRVEALGATAVTTRDHPSDNGNLLMDAHFDAIADPAALASQLNRTPANVAHGIFHAELVERVVVAGDDGQVRELVRSDPR